MYREKDKKWKGKNREEEGKEGRELLRKIALQKAVRVPRDTLEEIARKRIAGEELNQEESKLLESMGRERGTFLSMVPSAERVKKVKQDIEKGKAWVKMPETYPQRVVQLFDKKLAEMNAPEVVVVDIPTEEEEVRAKLIIASVLTSETPAPTVASAPHEEPKKEKVLWPEEKKVPQRPVSRRPKDRPIVENKKFVRAVRVILAQLNKEEAELVVKYQGRYMIPIVKEGMPFVRPEKEGFHVGVWWEGEESEFYVGETPVYPIRILPVRTTLEGNYLLFARTESLEVELNLKPLGNTVVFVVKDNIESIWIRNEEEERPFKPMVGARSRVYQELCAEEKKSSPMGKNSWIMDERGVIHPPLAGMAMSTDEVLDIVQKTLSEDKEKARGEKTVTVPETVTENAETSVPA